MSHAVLTAVALISYAHDANKDFHNPLKHSEKILTFLSSHQ